MTISPSRFPALPVRRLTVTDVPACAALAADRGWEPAPEKWRMLLELGEVYGVADPAGGLAGAVGLTRYGAGLAAIGKMLVAQRHGRQGLGGRLMSYALDQAPAVTCLLATEYGRPLYERLGFRAVEKFARYIGPLAAGPGAAGDGSARGSAAGGGAAGPVPVPREVTAADLAGITELDRTVFGADRGALLAALPRLADRFACSSGEDDGRSASVGPAGPDPGGDGPDGTGGGAAVLGYAAAWRSAGTLTVGPVVAASLDVATSLVTSLAGGSDLPLRMEVPCGQPGLARWLAARGLTLRSQATFMVRGGALPGARDQVYAPANMALC